MGCPLLLLLALLTAVTKAKVFSRCELARLLQEEGLDGYGGYSLANCEFQSPVSPQPFIPGCHHPHGWQMQHSLRAFCPCPGLCMAFYESTFNTAAQSIKVDGSADYGIFQISSQQWCTDDHSPSDNRCRMACRDLLSSNITDDITCAKRIVRNPQGMDAWEGWAMHCKGRDLSEWVEGCDL